MELDDFLDVVRREAGVGVSQREKKGTLVATSYNPKTHAIKGIIQPHGVETGWIPMSTPFIGNNFGIVTGPTVGQPQGADGAGQKKGGGDTTSQTLGDQFEIAFEGGDPNTPVARNRLYSDKDKPPVVESGEVAVVSKFNAGIKMNKDGSVSHSTAAKQADGKTDNTLPNMDLSTTSADKQGGGGKVGGKLTHAASDGDKKTHTVAMDPVAGTLTTTSKDSNSKVTMSSVLDLAGKTLSHTATDGTDTHSSVLDMAKGIIQSTTKAHSRTASSSITDTASSLLHKGATSVTGTLGVSGLLSGAGGAAFGAASFNIDATGVFTGTSGGSVTGGFAVDTLTASGAASANSLAVAADATITGIATVGSLVANGAVGLKVYTIAQLAGIAAPVIGMMAYVSDTVSNAAAAFNGVPTGGGATTVKRPVTYDGAAWRY